jgi:uncharacterized sulfatase
MIRYKWLALVCLVWALAHQTGLAARPNIVWIVSEDNSTHYLRHFNDGGAPVPNIAALAEHGVTFDRAFSNNPVCSVARTTLITGVHAPRLGAQFHRPAKEGEVELPEGWRMFPAYLQQAGYHTTIIRRKNTVTRQPPHRPSSLRGYHRRE